jgi:outer membrane protein assembly factor BamB
MKGTRWNGLPISVRSSADYLLVTGGSAMRPTILACITALAAASAAEPAGSWRGPEGNGTASSGLTLVNDAAQVKRVWDSDPMPGVYGSVIQSGNSGPTCAGDALYIMYSVPTGDDVDAGHVEKAVTHKKVGEFVSIAKGHAYWKTAIDWTSAKGDPQAEALLLARRKCAIRADDVLHCIDAATGKTRWIARFPTGINGAKQGRGPWIGAKCGPHLMPCIADGMVFTAGTSGLLHAVSAKDGKVLWQADLGSHATWEKRLTEAVAKKMGIAFEREFCTGSPAYADGVVAVHNEGGRILGFDALTGARKWSAGEGIPAIAGTPIVWTSGGKRYFIAFDTCIEATTGKVLWKAGAVPSKGASAAASLNGDILVAGTTAFRISPAKAEKIWTITPHPKCEKPEAGGLEAGTPAILDNRVLYRLHVEGTDACWAACDLATGSQVWCDTEISRPTGASCGSVVGGDGMLLAEYGRSGDYGFLMFRLGSDGTVTRQGRIPLPDHEIAASATPVYAAGHLYVRLDNGLRCYDLRAH